MLSSCFTSGAAGAVGAGAGTGTAAGTASAAGAGAGATGSGAGGAPTEVSPVNGLRYSLFGVMTATELGL